MKLKIQPDKQKAKALLKMAEITLHRLNELNKTKYPSNTLDDYYDIIHQLLEALSLLAGVKFKGEGAHQQLIDYACDTYNLGWTTGVFLQELRTYRNRIAYEGFSVSEDYIEQNNLRISEIIDKFRELISGKLE